MLVSDFHFELPEELIAQTPPAVRGASRMLAVDRETGACRDDLFQNLTEYLRAGDLLVLNDSRVIPARLYATREGSSGRIEVLLTEQIAPEVWNALVRPGRRVRVGGRLLFADAQGTARLSTEVTAAGEFGERTLRFDPGPDFLGTLERIGHMPLPPYIARGHEAEDRQRFQTVYAEQPGSVAAPTAGLHFTPEMLSALRAREVEIASVTLHVGLGTFQPLRVERLEDIRLHTERYTLPPATAAAVRTALKEGRRIVAAGTTTTRTLEHCAATGRLDAHSGQTSIFLAPGHRFRVVSGLLTNFHLPQSSLLMLVSAFLNTDADVDAGRRKALAAYAHAVRERYRFFSYGDCMLIL